MKTIESLSRKTRNEVSLARPGGRLPDGIWTPEAVCVAMHLYELSQVVKCLSNFEISRFLRNLFRKGANLKLCQHGKAL